MPVQVSRQHQPQQPHHSSSLTNTTTATATSYSLRRDSPASSRDDASSTSSLSIGKTNGDDGRQKKRLYKPADATSIPRKPSLREPRSPAKPLARPSVREQKKPLISRAPDFSSLKPDAQSRILQASSTSSSSAHSTCHDENGKVTTFYAFGDSKLKGSGALEEPFDFQPSMNLEDVHRGIIEHEPANSYPSPSRKASGASIRSLREQASTRDSAGSLLRRPSIGKFMASQNREARAAREAEAEAKETTSRRRQSNISSLTGTTPSSSKYRASAGTIEPASSVQGPRRQPSGASAPPVPPKYHRAGGYSENATEAGVKVSASTRSSKAKSLQPPPRQSHGLTLNTSTTLTPDQYRSAGLPSPRSPNAKKTTTPSSTASRRISTIPHASGLAARTISPTDARRLKRLSMMNTPPPPALPPPVDTSRSMPGSPMIPTKSATPSSQGTTPEPQRKSYSSGLSMSSTSTARTSVGSLQPKLALNLGSRLPRPPQLERDDEDIPPVPPLPKNLASPADIHPGDSSHLPSYDNTPVGTYKSTNSSLYGPRKSSFAPDNGDSTEPETQSLESDHTPSSDSPMSRTKSSSSSFAPRKSSLAPTQCEPCEEPEMFDLENFEPIHLEARDSPKPERAKSERDSRRKRGMTIGGLGAGGQGFQMLESKASSSSLRKKDLAPIRLPPLNLLPLSTPTIARVNAFGATSDSEGLTPPPQKGDKVPSTPMTAAPSKASFFARRDPDGRSSNYERSMSSFNHPLPNPAPADDSPSSLSLRAGSSASSSIPVSTGSRIGRQTASPYVSGSLTRGTSAAGSEKGTLSKRTTPVQSRVKSRARKSQDSLKNATPLEDVTESPSTSTSASIRRKLSLSWKKTSQGKNSHAANERAEEYGSLSNSTTTNMPPKLPSSSTWSAGMTAPDPPPTKTTSSHLTSQGRRKSSIGNTPVTTQHDRNKSDSSWSSPKKEKKPEEKAAPKTASAASSILSPMSKMLGSKGSLSQLRGSRTQPAHHNTDPNMDHDDLLAEEEMRRIAARKKNLDQAATQMDDLKRRAFSKDRMSPQQVLRMGVLNIFEKGEIVDYKDVYFTGTKDAKKHVGDLKNTNLPNFGYDDERGDYAIVKGDHLAYRYEIIDVLGKGSFGQVVRCIDHRSGGLVAIKIIRNKKRFHQQALVEVNILQKLKEWDPQQKHSLINFTQSFYFRGHLCISTELLGMNLYEFIKSNDFRGFSLKLIRRFTKQMLSSLVLLKGHRVIHCDLKPENILLAHPAKTEIKVIDFGSSCFENERVYTYIQSRFYRSPEVILGMSYGLPIDMWSLGCILAELYTGYPIFPGENEQEQLACIMEVFGPPEKHLIEKSTRRKLFFDSQGKPRMIVSSKGRRRRVNSKTLQHALKCDDEPFLDFVARCLRWDPEKRLKPEEALNHEFITGRKPPAPARSRSGNYASATAASRTNASYQRPLPDPPIKKPTIASTANTSTPMKLTMATPRTTTTTTTTTAKAPTLASASKRNSTGATIGSTLPRVAAATSNHRSISGKAGYGGGGTNTAGSGGRASAAQRAGTGGSGSIRMLRDDESGSEGRSRR